MNVLGATLVAAVASFGLVTAASALDRRVTVVNATSEVMWEFYASNVDRPTWEEDILGSNTVPAGGSFVVDIDDGSGYCMFDLRAVFRDGSTAESFGVNVCEVATFTFHD